jgi:hypothetical protein
VSPAAWLAPLLLLAGCNSIGAISGAAVGVATGAGTANPLVGYAAGVGTRVAVDELMKYVSRRRQQGEQDEIAAAVGRLGPGESAPWRIEHDIPIGNAHGTLAAIREVSTPLATCREVLFTVEDDGVATPFTTSICRDGDRWRWAAAEPAVPRWGLLQH